MPLGKYKNFAECVAANRDKQDPQAYCGAIEHMIKERHMMKERKDHKKKKSQHK